MTGTILLSCDGNSGGQGGREKKCIGINVECPLHALSGRKHYLNHVLYSGSLLLSYLGTVWGYDSSEK